MDSTSSENSRPGSPKKRSNSDATPLSTQSTEDHPESRDRSQTIPLNEDQRPHPAGFDSTDRVFPIRSVVSIDPTAGQSSSQVRSAMSPTRFSREGARQWSFINQQTWDSIKSRPQPQCSSPPQEILQSTSPIDIASPEADANNDETELGTQTMAAQLAQASQTPSDSNSGSGSTAHPRRTDEAYRHVTARFKHITTEAGHAVVTGRDGDSFQYCEDEPIHIPGAIQSFGVIIALREESPDHMVVRVVSENSAQLMGYTPKQLFELDNFCEILTEEQMEILLDHIDFVRDDAYDPCVDGPEVFALSITTPTGEQLRFWCATHVSPSQKDVIICELELEHDEVNPLNVAGDGLPTTPVETLGSVMPTPEEFAASTVNISQPLRVLRNARRRRGDAAAMEVFSILSQIQEQLGRANDLDVLLNITAGLVKELTGFHRVLVYQFDTSYNGLVVAELADPKMSIDLYRGLHFPASDIPAQARELYKINKVRLLYDRDHLTSRLVCKTLDDLETPLDMTHAYLRAMSPIHIKYLGFMQVRSSMSISITAFNDLWGLISCHSYGSAGMRVSFPIRKICRLLGDTVSRNIERLSYASRLQARKLINTIPTEANPAGYIIASSDDLLQLFDSDYGALSIRDETKILGDNTHSQEVLALLEFIRMRQINTVITSHDITQDFPDLHYPPGFKVISGLLYVPLSAGGRDFIIFFRKGQLTEIRWAGNPYKIQKQKETAGYLEPRNSFKAWRETVLSQSREWSESDVETAAVLCLVYGKFIKVWRQKEAAMQNSQLTRLLLANSAHEVRTPLNAIINYLEIALEGTLDNETRESLTKSHSASKSLIYVINDLLDLTNLEKGQSLIKDESFDLKSTFEEACDMLAGEAKRKHISYTVNAQPGIPPRVLGDQRRVRQVFTNVISNAIQQTASGAVTVEMWRSASQTLAGHVAMEIVVVDTGAGMSKTKLESLFHELEQVSTDDNSYPDEDELDESLDSSRTQQKRVLGLGLALVARIVYNMQGQLGVRSEEGKGSRVKILLQFRLPNGASTETPDDATVPGHVPKAQPPTISDGEFTFTRAPMDARESRRRSFDSLYSGGSSHSGRSQADRLISAMQEPPLYRRSERAGSRSSDRKKIHFSAGSHSSHTMSAVGSGRSTKSNVSPALSQKALSTSSNDHRASLYAVTHTPPVTLQPMLDPSAPGLENVTDSGVPMGAVRLSEQAVNSPLSKMREGFSYFPPMPVGAAPTTTETDGSEVISSIGEASTESAPTAFDKTHSLNILVAEDDPINSKILHKRLTKVGHIVDLTGNGEACANRFILQSNSFDVVLMDIQMPIANGMEATEMIREFESKSGEECLSEKAKTNSRVPIFAVSASLRESEKQNYIDTGFDGWVMKPISFTRLNFLLRGISDAEAKSEATYTPGQWENGGWF
ncbi:hypothetical protein N7495_009982 [Penicillium taxi]|uniref:uncharacterized protein n=1 Tax=Penicillium taxi TaxID=168475 RepID=UPI002545694E|nr:uncharacterized protein N7495_009982 [Penicillium taxi]KAJ5885472.1 hypothetical protein N7495_009982 [Penicillium taxi]